MLWRDYQSAYLLQKRTDETWGQVWREMHTNTHQICLLALPIQPQGESITFVGNDKIASVSEKKHQPFFVMKLKYDAIQKDGE